MSSQRKLYASGVPPDLFLFSGAIYSGSVIGGIIWFLILTSTELLTGIEYDISQQFIITLVVGVVIQVVILRLRKIRFSNPLNNTDLLALFDEIRTDLNEGQAIEIWVYNRGGDVFLSNVNLFYRAILLSENAIRDILAKRKKGKIVLAREVLVMEKSSPKLGFTIWLLVFSLFPYYFVLDPLAYLPFDLMILLFILLLIGSLPVFVKIFPPRLSETRHIDEFLEEKYGTSPIDAITDVLKDYTVANDLIAKQRWEEQGGGSVRRREVLEESLFVAIATSLISFILIVRFMPDPFFFVTIPILFSFLPGYLAFLIVYMFLFMLPLSKN